MTRYRIEWSARATDDLLSLSDWLTDEAGEQVADDYTDRVKAHVDRLRDFPSRGTRRDDIKLGLRTISYRGRTVIWYRVSDRDVLVVRVIHAGQDWDAE